MKNKLPSTKLIVTITFSLLSGISAYFFFRTYTDSILSGSLLTAQILPVILAIAFPLIIFALMICFYTFAVIISQNHYPALVIPIFFLAAEKISLTTIAAALVIFISFVLYSWLFYRNILAFKKPKIYICTNGSLGIPLALISFIITLTIYPAYNAQISKSDLVVNERLVIGLKSYLANIYLNGNTKAESLNLKTYAISKLPPTQTDSAIIQEEKLITTQLGVKAKETDTMSSILTSASINQLKSFITDNKNLLLIVIPLAFFFITQTFSTIASYIALIIIFTVEMILKKARLDLLEGI